MLILSKIDILIEQIANDKYERNKTINSNIGKAVSIGALGYALSTNHRFKPSSIPDFLANRITDDKLTLSDMVAAKTHNIISKTGLGDNIVSQLGGEIGGRIATGAISATGGLLVKGLINKYYDKRYGTTTPKTTVPQKIKNTGKFVSGIAGNTLKLALIKNGLSRTGMDVSSSKGIMATTAIGLATSYGMHKLKQRLFKKPNPNVSKTIDQESTSALLQGEISKCPSGFHRNEKRQCVRII